MNKYRVENRIFNKPWFTNSLDLFKTHSIMKSGTIFADYGCGALEFLEIIRNKYKDVELWGGNIEIKSMESIANDLNVTLFEFNGDDLYSTGKEFEGKFDVCSCLESLEHVVDADAYIQLMNRNLKPNGFLVLSVPDTAFLLCYLHYLKEGIPWKEGHHFRFFHMARIKQYIILNVFKIVAENHISPRKLRLFAKIFQKLENDRHLL